MDVILGLVQLLLNDPTGAVPALVSTNVYDFELPPESVSNIDFTMPVKSIVVKPHGGPTSPAMLEINDSRVQIQCYGETPHLAYTVYRAAYTCLKNVQSQKVLSVGTYIHWVKEASGPIPFRDPVLQWPYNIGTWTVRASDLTITA